MKNMTTKTIIAGLAAVSLLGSATAQEASVTADFASAYVFRGDTFNDGAVFQPGVEVGLPLPEEFGSLSIGAWGNYDIDDYNGALTSSQFSEVDWYVSYTAPIPVVDVSVGFTEYTYMDPAGAGGIPADKEISLGAGYEIAGVGLGLTGYYGVGGGILGNLYIEAGAEYGITLADGLDLSLGATAAYFEPETGESGLKDGSLSAGLSYTIATNWSVGASVAYIAQLDDEVLVDVDMPGGTYDVEAVGVLSLGCSF